MGQLEEEGIPDRAIARGALAHWVDHSIDLDELMQEFKAMWVAVWLERNGDNQHPML